MFKSIRSATRRLRSNNVRANSIDNKNPRHNRNTSINPSDITPTLLGLPGELRNIIYELVASQTNLILPVFRPRKIKTPPGLLLACKTTATEYSQILLQHASITARVYEYNFSSIQSVLTRLDEDSLDCLLGNVHLKIEIFLVASPTQRQTDSLKEWLRFRDTPSSTLYYIEFAYDFRFLPNFRPPRPLIRYRNGHHMRLDLLRAHIRMFNMLAAGERNGGDDDQQTPQTGEIFSIVNDAARMDGVYHELATANAPDLHRRIGHA